MTRPASAATIFALATPAGRGAVAVVRLSGEQSASALVALCGRVVPQARRAVLRRLFDAEGGVIDEALVLWMPAPASFTGEDCVELHLHGGRAVVAAVTDTLLAHGLRLAEAGEFTRRAFEHGRLDLIQAEAIADLVDAESGAQRRQALTQLDGALSRRFEAWREALLDALALLEAEIDFPDEDVPGAVGAEALPGIRHVAAELDAAVADLTGERVREGFRIAIVGAPNVGKSSLLNALARRDAAIVTPIAGTTRDVVEVTLHLGGQTVILADTAGLRETRDIIEAEGVRRAECWAAGADLRLGVIDRSRPETMTAVRDQLRADDLLVINKSDLPGGDLEPADGLRAVQTCASTADLGDLVSILTDWLERRGSEQEFPAITRRRHRELLAEARTHLSYAIDDLSRGSELAAEGVRLAIGALERTTGRSDPEAVLGRVFATFCIGK